MPRSAAVGLSVRLKPRGLLFAAVAAAALLGVSGCRREPEVKVKTPDEVRAEIRKVENDPNMPANVKGMVLGLLRQELAQAEKHAGKGK